MTDGNSRPSRRPEIVRHRNSEGPLHCPTVLEHTWFAVGWNGIRVPSVGDRSIAIRQGFPSALPLGNVAVCEPEKVPLQKYYGLEPAQLFADEYSRIVVKEL